MPDVSVLRRPESLAYAPSMLGEGCLKAFCRAQFKGQGRGLYLRPPPAGSYMAPSLYPLKAYFQGWGSIKLSPASQRQPKDEVLGSPSEKRMSILISADGHGFF